MNYYFVDNRYIKITNIVERIKLLSKDDTVYYYVENKQVLTKKFKEKFQGLNCNLKLICYNHENRNTDLNVFIIASLIGDLINNKDKFIVISNNNQFNSIKEYYKENHNINIAMIR